MAAGLKNLWALLLGFKAVRRSLACPCYVAAAAVFVSGAEAGQGWTN